jgi:DNA-directed RNA polymerase III subunit RPC1
VANDKQANAGRLWPVLNVELKSKNYNEEEGRLAMDAKDGYIVIRNSQLLCGNLCKNAMGGTKGGVLFVLIRDHGCAALRVLCVCCVF